MVMNQMAAEDLHIVHVSHEWTLGSVRSKTRNKTDTSKFLSTHGTVNWCENGLLLCRSHMNESQKISGELYSRLNLCYIHDRRLKQRRHCET